MKSINKVLQITCDGGAATGKSTGAKMIAKKYKLPFLSSGLLYRYASYLLIKENPINKIGFLKKRFKDLNYNKLSKINLHSPKISEYSAEIAKKLEIREILKRYQLNFIKKNKSCVLEGRDASTKILPSSDLKFFFVCNLNIAARRRYKELKKNNGKINFITVKKALKLRNLADTTRRHSKLTMHKNAVVVDTGKLNKRAMIAKMSKYVERILKRKNGSRARN